MSRRVLDHPEGIEDLLLFRMSKIVALGGGIVTRICEGQFGITRREWTVLAIVARAPSMALSEVGHRCEIDNARLSRAVSSLVAKKLMRKTHRPDRQIDLQLTDAGMALHASLFPIALDINRKMIDALDPQLVHALDDALALLHAQGVQLVRETVVPKARRSHADRRKA